MKYLLDTHAFLWWIGDDPALSEKARAIISAGENKIYLSAVSVWEIAIKSRLGRLEMTEGLEAFMDRQIRENSFQPLPITLTHSAKVLSLSNHHRDPFDQMLVAQSMVEEMPIISIDKMIGTYEVKVVW
ncbi:MAG: type II toxin-antitoxin system VapC family toxin [Verrucomicrobia bacterium]|nr:MAG: type II toxin-antitoxin system VapC family toxin [Verrucomicrobiota bacterium]